MISLLNKIINKIKHKIMMLKQKMKWRQMNSHNATTIITNTIDFPLEKVKVGKMTYGHLEVYSWSSKEEELLIGNYVSVGPEVKFLLGGNHRTDTLSTFPFKYMVLGVETEAISKGKIVIEDDVWIGMGSMILSGVKIGKGAVVAAGSIVTKDIPPYAIVGGNPAKIIRYRFEPDLIQKLESFDYSKLDDEFIKKNIDLLYQPMNKKICNELLK
jgi:acetyltransferase-like isoleucine patch superfamily enzyme